MLETGLEPVNVFFVEKNTSEENIIVVNVEEKVSGKWKI